MSFNGMGNLCDSTEPLPSEIPMQVRTHACTLSNNYDNQANGGMTEKALLQLNGRNKSKRQVVPFSHIFSYA